MKTLAILPARKGSKRIPGKNSRDFFGKPMFLWSLNAALESGCFNHVVVSTDCPLIAAAAQDRGAYVPALRPIHLADDHTPLLPVVQHTIGMLEDNNVKIDLICCVSATAPFLNKDIICDSFDAAKLEEKGFLVSVAKFPSAVQRALKQTLDGRLEMIDVSKSEVRTQDLEEAYFDACNFYWAYRDVWMQSPSILGQQCRPYILPRHVAQDIDTSEDWAFAERLMMASYNQWDKKASDNNTL